MIHSDDDRHGYHRQLFAAHAAILFMGMAGTLAHLSGFEPWRTTSYRVTFGAVFLLGIWLVRPNRPRLPPRTVVIMLLLGLVLSVHWFAFFRSIQLLGVILATAMLGLEPIFIALAAAIFLSETLGRRTILALVISTVGCAILGSGALADENLATGMLWSLFANASFATLVIANRIWVRKASPLLVTAVQMLGAIPLTMIMMEGDWLPLDGRAWMFAAILGLLCTGLAYGLYNGSMKVLPASVVGVMLSLEVVYGILGGVLVGDTMTALEGVAALLIANILVIDLALYFRHRHRETRLHT